MMKLLTWLDVRRKILEKTHYGLDLPLGVTRISSFSDAVEIGIADQASEEEAKGHLKKWFGDWFWPEKSVIRLDIDDAELPVEYMIETRAGDEKIPIRPFWEEITYLEKSDGEEGSPDGISLPEPFTAETPEIYAFYSFKGGVGRTLHLSAYLFALLERFREEGKKILVIDADLEAPGLTYWNRQEKQQQTGLSFIDFLEAYHYPPTDRESMLSFFAGELKRYVKTEGRSKVYFLPACIDDKELLDTPVLPEHLVRSRQGAWMYGDALYRLGRALGAEYLLIDMRSGTSEISSPLLFDPRIRRFIVSTVVEQSVRGTRLVLEHMGRVLRQWNPEDQPKYFDPAVILTMLDPDIRKSPVFENALEGFRASYLQSDQENIYSARLEITESDFHSELLYIQSWEEAREKLDSTSVMKMARAWADEQLRENIFARRPADPIAEVKKLAAICRKYEFAESGEGDDLLITEPLRNLATMFRDELPKVVSIGAKGAGKTFNYLQLARFGFWEKFVCRVLDEDLSSLGESTYIFPVLQSKNLHRKAEDVLESARSRFYEAHTEGSFSPSGFKDHMEKLEDETNRSVWARFWIRGMAEAVGISLGADGPQAMLNEMNQWLKERKTRIVFIFDGLEDLFADISSRPSGKSALESLIDLPKRLSEIRQANLGIIIFLRRDFLRYAITENLKQFENLYQPYDLHWNEEAFLKLVFWICSQADILDAKADELAALGREELIARLYELWGMKLGATHSREAYAVRWIYAALTDFKGRLQARDIVRFLYHAAEITGNGPEEVAFEKWSEDRLLPPQAIRRALKPCSGKKVEETKEEYPVFKRWVDDVLVKYPAADRRIPFTAEHFEMDPQTIRDLEDMGVIFEDRGKDGAPLYYIPEIFREGLDFSLDKGARPRVLILKRKAIGTGAF